MKINQGPRQPGRFYHQQVARRSSIGVVFGIVVVATVQLYDRALRAGQSVGG